MLLRFLSSTLLASVYFAPLQAQTASVPPSFEVATIRPNPSADPGNGEWSFPGIGRFTTKGLSMKFLIRLAYGINADQIVGGPAWMESECYDIAAKPEAGIKLTREELEPRLQNLLQQRFHLIAHKEMRERSGYELTVVKGGPHLTPTNGTRFAGFKINVSAGSLKGINWSMSDLTKNLGDLLKQPVADRTGIQGSYDFSVEYARDDQPDSTLPSLFTALTEATGLRLTAAKIPVEALVIDSIDKTPTPN